MGVTICGVVSQGDFDAGVPAQFTEAELDLTYTSVRTLAAHLGLEYEFPAGDWDAREVKERCVLARAVGGTLPDFGYETTESGGPGTGQCRWVECGRPPGWLAARVAALEEVADECLARGVEFIQYA
jgi:hypothetical protein